MSVAITKAIELTNTLYDYLIGLDETGLFPFLSGWPSEPFKTRIVFQNRIPVV